MIDLHTTLLWWVLTRYHVWAIGSALLAVWAFVEMWNEPDEHASFLIWCVFLLLCLVHWRVWHGAKVDRERVRRYIRRRVLDAEEQWMASGKDWVTSRAMPRSTDKWLAKSIDILLKSRGRYMKHRDIALNAALRRPDLWGKWTLNVYCGETDTHFASGCDSWPKWVWEPVEQ